MILHDLLDEGRRLYFSGESIKDATAKIVTDELNRDDLSLVLYEGFHALLAQSIRNDRYAIETAVNDKPLRPALQFAPSRRQGAASYHALARIHYEGADGRPKPLLDFNADDCRHRLNVEAGIMRGAQQRSEFFTSASSALKSSGKRTIGMLATSLLQRLNDEAEAAFGRAGTRRENEHEVGPSDVSGGAS